MDLIKIFNKIRDLPYHCPESINDKDLRCWGKNRILYKKLKEEGFKVRFRVCDFEWSEQKFPSNITSLAPKDLDYHLFLEVKLDDWIIIDCSNDSLLPEYNEWNNCKIAVKYNKIYSPKESVEIEKNEKLDLNNYEKLYIAINKFLKKLRRK